MKRTTPYTLFTIVFACFCSAAFSQIDTNAHHIVTLPPINDIDVFWTKRVLRDISVYEKRNRQLRDDPRTPQKNVFANILLSGINTGAFNAYADNGNEPGHSLTKEEISALIKCDPASLSVNAVKFWSFCAQHKNDSMEFTLEEDGTDKTKAKNELNQATSPDDTAGIATCSYPQQIEQYRIAEDWIFDKRHGEMQVRIVAIAPMVHNKPLFWLFYPDIRKYMNQFEMYKGIVSFGHDWDWYFVSRNFSSKIIKMGEPRYSSEQKK